jgi:hypothetical protein
MMVGDEASIAQVFLIVFFLSSWFKSTLPSMKVLVTNQQIKSFTKNHVYSRKFDRVEISASSGDVLICRNLRTGELFPVTKDKVVEIEVQEKPKTIVVPETTKPVYVPPKVEWEKPIKEKSVKKPKTQMGLDF